MKTRPVSTISFTARMLRPAAPPKGATWTFVVLPRTASEALPSRGMIVAEGTLNGRPFRADLEPDGRRSHWFKVPRALRTAAGAQAGDLVEVSIRTGGEPLEAKVPADLRAALAEAPEAQAAWRDLTPGARTDWIHWIVSARKAETRARRVAGACDMLACGKRRVCCFDRSGVYGGGMSAPEAAVEDDAAPVRSPRGRAASRRNPCS